MYKIFLSLFISQIFLFAQNPILPSYETSLLSVQKGFGQIQDSKNIVVGSSGIIIHDFDEEKRSIIARATVTKKENDLATIRFEFFDALEQKAFPIPGILPQKDDTVIMNFLYDRSLIIAPNKEIYEEVTKHFNTIEWIHPDILSAYLSKKYQPSPTRKDFKEICRQNSAGIIFIALNKESFFADCKSFKILKTFKTGEVASYELPFYARITQIDSAFWKFGEKKIKDYNRHYKSLLVK